MRSISTIDVMISLKCLFKILQYIKNEFKDCLQDIFSILLTGFSTFKEIPVEIKQCNELVKAKITFYF